MPSQVVQEDASSCSPWRKFLAFFGCAIVCSLIILTAFWSTHDPHSGTIDGKTGWEEKWLTTVRSPPFATTRKQKNVATLQGGSFHLCEDGVDPVLLAQQRERYLPLSANRTTENPFSHSDAEVARRPKIYFAINLHNSEALIGDMAVNLQRVFDHFGHDNVFLSIYEDGSKDQTKEYLRLWDAQLTEAGVRHNFTMLEKGRAADLERIPMLAAARNEAMSSLYTSKQHEFDFVFFLNDVYFCPSDIFELVYQSILQRAHISFGIDLEMIWRWPRNPRVRFYDRWVSRLINGRPVTKLLSSSLSGHPPSQERFDTFLPFQALSGWNGGIVIDARLFYDEGIVFRAGKMSESDCMMCECQEVCHDAWEKGRGRIVMVPRVRPVYEVRDFVFIRGLQNKWPKSFPPRSDELIDFVDLPKTFNCLSILPGAHRRQNNVFDFPGTEKKVIVPEGYNVRTDNLPFERFSHLIDHAS